MTLQGTLGFLGFGNMGRAIAGGLIETGTLPAAQMAVWDVAAEKRAEAAALGIAVLGSAEDLGRKSTMLLLAVKPQNMEEALQQVRPGLSNKALVISIAAGISTRYIEERLGAGVRVVRVMPNTPALVRAGAAAMALGAFATQADAQAVRTIFEAIGMLEETPESAMDVVTALSGSGPAYFFKMVESLVAAAVHLGLPEDQAGRLAAQTLHGAGLLLRQSGESPAVLRQRVTSKGGTTEAALARFAEKGFDEVIRAGVAAAAARSKELGK